MTSHLSETLQLLHTKDVSRQIIETIRNHYSVALFAVDPKGVRIEIEDFTNHSNVFVDLLQGNPKSNATIQEMLLQIASELSTKNVLAFGKGAFGLSYVGAKIAHEDINIGSIIGYGFTDSSSFEGQKHSIESAFRVKFPELADRAQEHTAKIIKLNSKEIQSLKTHFHCLAELARLYLRSPNKSETREKKKWEIVGESKIVKSLKEQIIKISDTNATVLISGENGTGKELIARNLHIQSNRRNKPFIAVNCGALHQNLLESELFGHMQGSFTGATNTRKGLFETAEGGTLFLDEIGEMSQDMQVKLLRAIQEREIVRMGSHTPIKFNVRLIVATNRNLEKMVSENTFRQDLFYRLRVIELTAPPLRQRREDIPLLCNYYLEIFNPDSAPPIIKSETLEALKKYSWPGNIRQLRNEMERLSILSPGSVVEMDLLSPRISQSSGDENNELNISTTFVERRKSNEQSVVLKALEKFDWNKAKAARELGISRTALNKKIAELALKP